MSRVGELLKGPYWDSTPVPVRIRRWPPTRFDVGLLVVLTLITLSCAVAWRLHLEPGATGEAALVGSGQASLQAIQMLLGYRAARVAVAADRSVETAT